jgi:ankyrin repeat protein
MKLIKCLILAIAFLSEGAFLLDQNISDAVQAGNLDLVKVLVERNPQLVNGKDGRDRTPLHTAVAFDHKEIVKYLLAKGAAVDAKDNIGRTPLAYAAWKSGNLDITKLLIEKGADVDSVNRWGATVLSVAMDYRRHEMTGYLLARKIDQKSNLGERNREGTNLLHWAARCGSLDVIHRLIQAGLQVTDTNIYGWTPLHFAADLGQKEALALLLDKAADKDARTRDGHSAYDLAVESGYPEAAAFLSSQGADTRGPKFPVVTGSFFGQKTPGPMADQFAVGIVASRYRHHGSPAFSADGREAYWAVLDYGKERSRVILESKMENGRWTLPRLADFSQIGWDDDAPSISPDGRKLFFISSRPTEKGGKTDKENIWVMEKAGAGWSAPKPLPPVVNSLAGIHHQVSVDREGNLYFSAAPEGGFGNVDIYCSLWKDGAYQKPANLGSRINGSDNENTPFIAPDGSYLIFAKYHPEGWAPFISYRIKNGDWTPAQDLSLKIQCPWIMKLDCPSVTRDGKYLFFEGYYDNTSKPFWVEARFIEELRPKE